MKNEDYDKGRIRSNYDNSYFKDEEYYLSYCSSCCTESEFIKIEGNIVSCNVCGMKGIWDGDWVFLDYKGLLRDK